jgi:rare lipoprotein A
MQCATAYAQTSHFKQIGHATYYANKFHGRKTTSGERYNKNKYTAAHRTLPFGTLVKVTNMNTGTWVVVRINDRGPFVRGKIIDLSGLAARKLDIIKHGSVKVKLEIYKEDIPVDIDSVYASNDKFYKVDIQEYMPPKYGVQIATFKTTGKVVEFLLTLKPEDKQEVYIMQSDSYYNIIYGRYENSHDASEAAKLLRIKFKDCIAIKLDDE